QPDPKKRIWGTASVCCAAIANGADIIRVHDVAEMVQVCRVADAIWR
ncbi:MAG: dihydropteroate synthase, partial [Microcystaceae cyanobacterium]